MVGWLVDPQFSQFSQVEGSVQERAGLIIAVAASEPLGSHESQLDPGSGIRTRMAPPVTLW